jgi:hypothetical protein
VDSSSQGWTETGYNRYPEKRNSKRRGKPKKSDKQEGIDDRLPVCTIFNTSIKEIYK